MRMVVKVMAIATAMPKLISWRSVKLGLIDGGSVEGGGVRGRW